jgi:hypothetical protein
MSMGHMVHRKTTAVQLEAASKSFGHLDYDMDGA